MNLLSVAFRSKHLTGRHLHIRIDCLHALSRLKNALEIGLLRIISRLGLNIECLRIRFESGMRRVSAVLICPS